MRLTMREEEVSRIQAKRYQEARKKEKGKILDEFTEATGYNRSYASYVLSRHGRKQRVGREEGIGGRY
jgi:protein-disulfide isomerase-like protein with CxxC motif